MSLTLLTATATESYAEPLTPEEKDTIQNQLMEAKSTLSELDHRLECYEITDQKLQTQSLSLQENSANLRRKEQQLNQEISVTQNTLSNLTDQSADLKNKLTTSRKSIEASLRRVKSIQSQIASCKKDLWILGFTCDWASEIMGLTNIIREQNHNLNVMLKKQKILEGIMSNLKLQYDEASQKSLTYQKNAQKTSAQIKKVEAGIKETKKTLAHLRIQKQEFGRSLQTLKQSLKTLDTLDPESQRRYYQNKLRRETETLSSSMLATQKTLKNNHLKLPDGNFACL